MQITGNVIGILTKERKVKKVLVNQRSKNSIEISPILTSASQYTMQNMFGLIIYVNQINYFIY